MLNFVPVNHTQYMSILTRTYPFKQSAHWLRDSAVYGVVIWAILYFLQPFGISLYTGNKCLFASAFGVVTAVCYASYGCVVSKLLHPLVTPWRIWHQCCAVFGLVLFIALCNLFLFSSITHCSITAATFLLFLYWTLVIGVILTALSVGIDYNRSLRERMEELLNKTTEEQSDITITICGATVRGNDLTIPINNLLYIEAQKNNVSVCFVKDNVPTAVTIHTTLTAVTAALKDYDNVFQCHRSFVVNVNNITSARGNSNGYQLTLGTCTAIIPVSRSYVPRLRSFIS